MKKLTFADLARLVTLTALLTACGGELELEPDADNALQEDALSSNLVPLKSWWSDIYQDNVLAVSFSVAGYTQFRTEGYIYPASVGAAPGYGGALFALRREPQRLSDHHRRRLRVHAWADEGHLPLHRPSGLGAQRGPSRDGALAPLL